MRKTSCHIRTVFKSFGHFELKVTIWCENTKCYCKVGCTLFIKDEWVGGYAEILIRWERDTDTVVVDLEPENMLRTGL